eukprot:359636-Chlamydomonas_euryale.AAC.7
MGQEGLQGWDSPEATKSLAHRRVPGLLSQRDKGEQAAYKQASQQRMSGRLVNNRGKTHADSIASGQATNGQAAYHAKVLDLVPSPVTWLFLPRPAHPCLVLHPSQTPLPRLISAFSWVTPLPLSLNSPRPLCRASSPLFPVSHLCPRPSTLPNPSAMRPPSLLLGHTFALGPV